MIKNFKEKVGIVSGMVVTNGLDTLSNNKVVLGIGLGINLLDKQNVVEAVKKTAKQTGIAGFIGGTVMTLAEKNEIKALFKELDSEETEEVMEGEE
ncbi:TPA: hypothetical protein SIF56_004483 [Escherichia coli]|nr:hypothetical protein [Escherichia coli]